MNATEVLRVELSGVVVGHLSHDATERSRFEVSEDYIDLGPDRPILSLSMARPGNEAQTIALLRDGRHRSSHVKAPPFFSNLLPEGALRMRIAHQLKVHEDRECLLLAALGNDLPGAVRLLPSHRDGRHPVRADGIPPEAAKSAKQEDAPSFADSQPDLRFSLGGMQLKFSMLRAGDRYSLQTGGQLGDHIVKPPSMDFPGLPRVEAATMETARAVGIEVPEVHLLPASRLIGLPSLPAHLADEPFYAIRRFDRQEGARIHIEDFAQVFNLRPSQKYNRVNYDMIGATLLRHAGGLDDLMEMCRRLVLNALIGNGDAHIKNWSLIYQNPCQPRLAPAYDLVSTVAYSSRDTTMALNMNGIRAFSAIGLDTFDKLFRRIGISDHARASLLDEASRTARNVIDVWADLFQLHQVPAQLVDRIGAHMKTVPLARAR